MKEKNITFHNIFYLFLFGCIFGWIVEGIWTLLKKGILINHSALIIGPFNIVYGVGAIILTLFLYKLKDKGNIVIFGMSFTIGTLLEYLAFEQYAARFAAILIVSSSRFWECTTTCAPE